ncbi:PITH domain-containing protein [Citrus sinensis]|uniref:PITH domain-containing protein n=1 Tax=Citrus sinensis TaxID=2711 RepID=A0ACB8NP18_CITSI|nr:PITH domain-containing protein [Citrus sinensis]KAH9799876.1 PITH domain-containing protein [Citrus sinensis]
MACLHDHSCEDHDCSSDWSLYKHIDLSKVSALNEAVPGSVKSVFKAWEQRLNSSGVIHAFVYSFVVHFLSRHWHVSKKRVSSVGVYSQEHLESNDGDPELLVYIPFINREGIDFSDAQDMQAIQEWDLVENLQGVLEYQTRYSKFQSVANITLHFPDNFGGDTTQIHYIGLKGEATQLKRDVVATIVYELRPNPSDHKTKSESGGGLSHVE